MPQKFQTALGLLNTGFGRDQKLLTAAGLSPERMSDFAFNLSNAGISFLPSRRQRQIFDLLTSAFPVADLVDAYSPETRAGMSQVLQIITGRGISRAELKWTVNELRGALGVVTSMSEPDPSRGPQVLLCTENLRKLSDPENAHRLFLMPKPELPDWEPLSPAFSDEEPEFIEVDGQPSRRKLAPMRFGDYDSDYELTSERLVPDLKPEGITYNWQLDGKNVDLPESYLPHLASFVQGKLKQGDPLHNLIGRQALNFEMGFRRFVGNFKPELLLPILWEKVPGLMEFFGGRIVTELIEEPNDARKETTLLTRRQVRALDELWGTGRVSIENRGVINSLLGRDRRTPKALGMWWSRNRPELLRIDGVKLTRNMAREILAVKADETEISPERIAAVEYILKHSGIRNQSNFLAALSEKLGE